MKSLDEVSPDLAAMLDLERARIREKYGPGVSLAVGQIMQSIVISALLYSKHEGLEVSSIVAALAESIGVINRLADEYVERVKKAPLN
jgi:hypothetical protein